VEFENLNKNKIRCLDCEHYFITWDSSYPYGCRKVGFKSKYVPRTAVFEMSDMNCLAFSRKKEKKKGV
jgi:hypothetical protein